MLGKMPITEPSTCRCYFCVLPHKMFRRKLIMLPVSPVCKNTLIWAG